MELWESVTALSFPLDGMRCFSLLPLVRPFFLGVLLLFALSALFQRPIAQGQLQVRQSANATQASSELVVGFYHASLMNDWAGIMNEQLAELNSSGLLAASKAVYISILGPPELWAAAVSNTSDAYVYSFSPNWTLHEYFTLMKLWKFCRQHPDYYVYYFHTKGVTVPPSGYFYRNKAEWRREMQSCIFTNWRAQLSFLKAGGDAAGARCKKSPEHFSGNFWWASCDWISEHQAPTRPSRNMIAHAPKAWANGTNFRADMVPSNRIYAEMWLLDSVYAPKVKCC